MAEVTPLKPGNSAQAPPQKPRGKNKSKKKPSVASQQSADPPFFNLVRSVPAEDWGHRAYMYVYCTEPICDLKKQGGYSYLTRSAKPILDLQELMQDFGSFKGYMTLNRRKAGDDAADMIDKFDFEIYNPKYPPKIPRAAWLKDSRNERWAALLPPEEPAKTATNGHSAGSLSEIVEVITKLEDRAAARFEENQELPPDPVEQLKSVTGILKDLKGDEKKSDTGITELFKMFLESQTKQIDALRLELATARQVKPPEDPITKKLMEKLVDDFIEGKKEPAEKETFSERTERSRMSGNQEFWQGVIDSALKSPTLANLTQGFAFWLMSRGGARPPQPGAAPAGPVNPYAPPPAAPSLPQAAAPAQPQPAAPAQPQPAAQPEAAPVIPIQMKLSPEQLSGFVGQIMQPLMLHLQDKDKDGWDLAEWVISGQGKPAYLFIKNQGVDTIMQAFRLSQFWSELAPIEPQLKEFIDQFCSWPPPDNLTLENDDEEEDDTDPEGRISLED